MKRLYQPYALFYALLFALLAGCAALTGADADTLNKKIAVAQGTVTQVRVSATQMLQAKQISVTDAQNVLKTTDAAEEGITVARTIGASDPAAADAKLKSAVIVLTALQAYLAAKGAK